MRADLARRRFLAHAGAALFAQPAFAQGFAGLGQGGEGFALPDPAYVMAFPRDHLAHPSFRIEWWYLTANLTDESGADWGVQWTLFRTALDPADAAAQVWMGHAAVTSRRVHLTAERLARPGQAGVAGKGGLDAWIDEWRMAGDPGTAMRLRAGGEAFAYDLSLRATGPLVRHGASGYSVKSAAGQASHYYSQPFLSVSGEIETTGGRVFVTGSAWLDREWSSEPLAPDQSGWDWFSLHLDSGEKLMAFVLRGTRPFGAASWIAPDGRLDALSGGAIRAEPLDWAEVARHRLPVVWRLGIPAKGFDVTLRALRVDAWMPMLIPYWEGPVLFEGSHSGRGYLEMTGHD